MYKPTTLVPRVSWTRLRANDVTAIRSGKPKWGSACWLISQITKSSVQGKFERLESSEKECMPVEIRFLFNFSWDSISAA